MQVYILLAVFAFANGERIKGTTVTSDYEAFKEKYNKNYSASEDDAHYRAYTNAVEYINNHNAEYDQGNSSFWCGLNEWSDMTDKERDTRNSYRLRTVHHADRAEVRNGDPTTSPNVIDWREKGVVNGIKDQGECGSCWAFSAVCALEGQWAIHRGALPDVAEQQLVSCDDMNHGCAGGFPEDSYFYISANGENGIDTQASYPYTATESMCDNDKTSDGKDVAATCTFFETVASSEDALQEAVGNIGPISICLAASSDCFHQYSGGILDDPSCGELINHAVAAVGYDTTANYWIIRNSWGTSWGESGYVRIVMGKKMCGLIAMSAYPTL